jgi:acetyl-CoA carboxylase biotin carboxyl carrier protein
LTVNLTEKSVAELIRQFDKSNLGFLRIRSGDVEITLGVDGGDLGGTETAAVPPPVAPTGGDGTRVTEPAAERTAAVPAPPVTPTPTSAAASTAVSAPMVGTFFRSPEPTAKPFVEVGDEVTPDTTVGLVEAMKMFTAIPAGVAGKVVEILAGDAELVEFGQTIMRIEERS